MQECDKEFWEEQNGDLERCKRLWRIIPSK
jgi:hypothetical protein